MANTILCGSSCATTTQPPVSYHKACDPYQFRKLLYPYFALVSCDVAIPNPNDISAWTALCTGGDIKLSPKGNLVIPTPNQNSSENIDPCVGAVVTDSTYELTFTTYNAKLGEDCKYWSSLLRNASNYRLIVFDCDGNATLTDDYINFIDGTSTVAPTGSPGFQFSISSIPHAVAGDGNRAAWSVTFQIKLDGNDMLCYTPIEGLLTALQNCA